MCAMVRVLLYTAQCGTYQLRPNGRNTSRGYLQLPFSSQHLRIASLPYGMKLFLPIAERYSRQPIGLPDRTSWRSRGVHPSRRRTFVSQKRGANRALLRAVGSAVTHSRTVRSDCAHLASRGCGNWKNESTHLHALQRSWLVSVGGAPPRCRVGRRAHSRCRRTRRSLHRPRAPRRRGGECSLYRLPLVARTARDWRRGKVLTHTPRVRAISPLLMTMTTAVDTPARPRTTPFDRNSPMTFLSPVTMMSGISANGIPQLRITWE